MCKLIGTGLLFWVREYRETMVTEHLNNQTMEETMKIRLGPETKVYCNKSGIHISTNKDNKNKLLKVKSRLVQL